MGAQESAIVNGVVDGHHPSVVVLLGTSACTATLIGPRTVLTAAHCVVDRQGRTASSIEVYPQGLNGPRVAAARVVAHPRYPKSGNADVAVLQLAVALDVAPVSLGDQPPRAGEPVELVGFGTPAEGSKDFGVRRRASNTVASVAPESFTVLGAGAEKGNLCDGDSGGPTFVARDGQDLLVGVHSTKGGACGNAGSDVRVDAFVDWIRTTQDALEQGGPDGAAAGCRIGSAAAGDGPGVILAVLLALVVLRARAARPRRG